MKSNVLVDSQKAATAFLLKECPIAKTIPGNSAKIYVISQVSDLKRNGLSQKSIVWAVKTGKYIYSGFIYKYGVTDDSGKLINAFRVNFADGDILKELNDGDFIEYYHQLKNHNGNLKIIRRVALMEQRMAAEILNGKYPKTIGRDTVMIRTNKCYGTNGKYNFFWAAWDGLAYQAINPCSQTEWRFDPLDVKSIIGAGERLDDTYRLVNGKYGLFICLSKECVRSCKKNKKTRK